MFADAIAVAKCHTGSTIETQKVLDVFGLKLHMSLEADILFDRGGILTIMHPVCNLHAVAVVPEGSMFKVFNSWLGPPVCYFEKCILSDARPNRRVWVDLDQIAE